MNSDLTVVVQVHPLEESYNAALRDQVVRALQAGTATVACYRLAHGERPPLAELARADRLVLVYPTWNGGLPSALLGWIHDLLDDEVRMPGVRQVVAVTTCGSSQFVNRVQGEWGRRYLRTVLAARCAPRARFRWLPLYKVDRRSPREMTGHLDRVAGRLSR